MELFAIVTHGVTLIVGGALGAAFYRSRLKKDPAKLEEWAAAAKAAGKRAGF